jgi:hypothetical protein
MTDPNPNGVLLYLGLSIFMIGLLSILYMYCKPVTTRVPVVLPITNNNTSNIEIIIDTHSISQELIIPLYKSITPNEECVICCDNLTNIKLKCSHEFCNTCITKFNEKICPYCRTSFIKQYSIV